MSAPVLPVVLGVDPGWKDTGLCARQGGDVLGWAIVSRERDEDADSGGRGVAVGPEYCQVVIGAIDLLRDGLAHAGHDPDQVLMAVEGIVRPNPHVNRRNGRAVTDPTHALGTAIVHGAVIATWPDAVVVPPGGNGSQPLAYYPAGLVSDAERRHGLSRVGEGERRHARSAFDVAGAAPGLLRLRHAAARARAARP